MAVRAENEADFASFSESLSIEEMLKIPEDVMTEILSAGADVGADAMQREISAQGLVDTGRLSKSIVKRQKKRKEASPFPYVFYVFPTGKRRQYEIAGKKRTVGNNDVGFVLEYGAPRRGIIARQWVRKAMEQNADKVVEAELQVYDKYLKSLGG